ncbi:protein SMAX1-LIKE 6-like isoform X2 [Glycine soja]|uniref:Protein SMAX1-LIKE 7 isoform A n=1 Tax=Glycine soja TaxID=3848 RepID=A0A445H884_GLYSO|nr:protein SMAX1-LIKE 6-like isoform X2 [Glycine soja]RZB69807.1 Protein SMAX1-LIKE 7 isoform A [Glycine soja]
MPTPVSVVRQCLTDEAARALDDAVAVARRRSHAQTTSLHAISALLALPSSALRDACGRARSGAGAGTSAARFSAAYSPRLQFRALELSVGVSLDRLPSSKSTSAGEEEPPVSNSLMAAIKRSQANQRRHPESFHMFQQSQQGTASTSFLKVELKHFVLSILDDPIVSRVFAEAGFRSCDIKLALLQPPLPPVQHRFNWSPPVFLCNLDPAQPDENIRRIMEVLARKNKRNPLLMGVYAKSALKGFVEMVRNGRGGSALGSELRVVRLEREIGEFVKKGGSGEEKFGVRLKELEQQCEGSGSGVVVSFGEIEVFVGEDVDVDVVRFVVLGLTRLLEIRGEKVSLLGVAETSHAYSKFLGLFPNVENDWDLHLLTVTSATPSMEGLYSKSSLMGSFVPFGGFFSTPEIRSPVSCANGSFTRCDTCNKKCEQEVADLLKVDPSSSYSTSSHWLQKVVNMDAHRGSDVAKTNEENTSLNDKILGFQKKWSDICQRLHHTSSLPQFDISQTRSQAPTVEVLRFGLAFKESSNKDPSHSEFQYSSQISCMPKELHSIFPSKQLSVPLPSDTVCINTGTDHVPKVSETLQIHMNTPWVAPSLMANKSALDHRSSSFRTPVTTDLGLGTLYTSTAQDPDTPKLQDQRKHLQHLSDSVSTDCDGMNENTSHRIARFSCSGSNLEGKFDLADFKSLDRLLTEKVGWQDQAICAISQTLSLCKSGAGKRRGSNGRADIWLAFLGPDRLGKRKIASVLAETIFGNPESLISVDLGFQDSFYPLNSVFEYQKSRCYDVLRRKTILDYIAGELSKKPHSVVFLENVDKADVLVQNSLLQAVRTGKFSYSHGRVISINNTIFLVTSTVCKGNGSFVLEESKMFSEERILEAKRCQMQLLLGHASEDAGRIGSTNVKVVPGKGFSKSSSLNKRKQADISDSKEGATSKMQKQDSEASRSYLDLNMPVEEGEEGVNDDHESESITENTDAWLSDFFDQIDEKVVFKSFNFDELAEEVLKRIGMLFQRTFGSELQLEIDYEVITHILAAAWLSDKKNAVEDWVEHVLGKGFVEAQQKYLPAAQYVVKLVNCESIFVEEQAPDVCLPARINTD